ncbi:DUF6705 family protein [Elizabethkingia meningoseptica]|uniref:DUF6705 family protein n=1 Tax=Elizabethkingia meningoseptica TaxID=238 RepID=UPI0023AF656C|nr:DUF6705 family protein [Elizabethkingia meningoseptica]MDE5431527.1 hypothetical protein [Elizabethkingia meningoseptica]
MKNLLFIVALIFSFSCAAQEYPLNTSYRTIPKGSYLKDTKNELPRYTGMWKAVYNNKEITLNVQKVDKSLIQFLNYSFYGDVVLVRYTVKDGNGNILQSTMNRSVNDSNIISTYILPDAKLGLSYSGGDCGVGSGIIYFQYIDTTHLKWSYSPQDLIFMQGECPQGSDLKVYLPKTEDLVFTKQ